MTSYGPKACGTGKEPGVNTDIRKLHSWISDHLHELDQNKVDENNESQTISPVVYLKYENQTVSTVVVDHDCENQTVSTVFEDNDYENQNKAVDENLEETPLDVDYGKIIPSLPSKPIDYGDMGPILYE